MTPTGVSQIPPKPPDDQGSQPQNIEHVPKTDNNNDKNGKWGGNQTFKSILLKPYAINQGHANSNDIEMDDLDPDHIRNEEDYTEDTKRKRNHVEITEEDKKRICKLWNYSVIIKLFGKKLN